MRDGFKVYDADTHIQPWAETIRPYLDSSVLALVPDLDDHQVEIKIGLAAEVRQPPYKHWYRFGGEGGWGSGRPRVLGEAEPREGRRHFQKFMGAVHPTEGGADVPEIRLKDMDREGVDVHVMVPSGPVGHPNPAVDVGFIQANHRFLNDFCSADSARLKSLIVVSPRCVEESIAEIRRWGKSPWAVGIQPSLPLDYPLDHPDLNPVWGAAADEGLCVVHHSFASGYPGYRDLWDNPFIGRSASHPWAAMRAVASFIGGGVMERYPSIRFAVLESGFGWIPFWARRLDDQVEYMGYVAESLTHKVSDYMTGGRFFASIVLHEGEDMVRMVNEYMGDQLLMFGSDYTHAESRFPETVDIVVGWKSIADQQKRKLLWENAVRCFGEP